MVCVVGSLNALCFKTFGGINVKRTSQEKIRIRNHGPGFNKSEAKRS